MERTTTGGTKEMYRFSRSIYRELSPRVIEDEWDLTRCANKQKVLEACEGAIRRLTYDWRYFAKPARTLFNDVRPHFAMGDQLFVWTVIERNINLALEFLSRMPEGVGLDGRPPECNAHTRKGTRVSAGHCRAGTTARRTSTWKRRSRESSCRSRRSTASSSGWQPPNRDSEHGRPRPTAGAAVPSRAVGSAHAAGSRRWRDVHRRRAVRRARAAHGEVAHHPDDQSRGVLAAVEAALERAGATPVRSRPSPTG